ncbi:MAG: hypothetical protein P1P88_02855 [Bacteroidales bacterium]|nr:hypothetical protein [Bacteroidales bacterium]
MKTHVIILGLIFLISSQLHAQLKYEGTIDARYKTIQLDDGSFKYVKYNQKEQKVFIYNLDNTIWRTIKLPLPKDHLLDEIKHISQHAFNKDDEVELVYSCVVYHISDNIEDTEKDNVIVRFTLNIINESGEQLLKVHDSNEMEIIDSQGQKKLLIYKHLGKHFNGKDETLIYSF